MNILILSFAEEEFAIRHLNLDPKNWHLRTRKF
jgi:hypothetical protein